MKSVVFASGMQSSWSVVSCIAHWTLGDEKGQNVSDYNSEILRIFSENWTGHREKYCFQVLNGYGVPNPILMMCDDDHCGLVSGHLQLFLF